MGFLKRDDDNRSRTAPARETEEAVAEEGVAFDDVPPAEAPHQDRYQAGSLEGIPESGRERLERMRQDVERGFFTSDLSINEFLLVKEAGFEPLGLVLGSSIYHIGIQMAPGTRTRSSAC